MDTEKPNTGASKRVIEKRKVFDGWMKDDHVLVQLNSRIDGVAVPDNLKDDASVTLKISYLFRAKTEVDEQGITAYLLFGDNYFECIIPWIAIWGIRSCHGEQKYWPEDVPKELMVTFARAKLTQLEQKFRPTDKSKEKEEKKEEAPAGPRLVTTDEKPEPKPPKPKPELKRIK